MFISYPSPKVLTVQKWDDKIKHDFKTIKTCVCVVNGVVVGSENQFVRATKGAKR